MNNTYLEINTKNIKYNVQKIINTYNTYKYYIGIVKADCYGHKSNKVIKNIIDGGCNYLAVARLEEALKIREEFKTIPILILGIVDKNDLDICKNNNLTITISNLNQLKEYKDINIKVHIKINTGMNRLGINNKDELNEVIKIINNSNFYLEGIYTHLYKANDTNISNNQFKLFEQITSDINLNTINIVHIVASEGLIKYNKKNYLNGCRLGIIMYNLIDNNLGLKDTFKLVSEVIQINEVNNETVGYNGSYKCKEKERIAVIPIGYADGIIRKNTGRYVFINNRKYKIIGNICMDMLFVKVDETVKVHDKVIIIKDSKHIKEISKYLNTIPYEIITNITNRIKRIYK